MLVLLVDDDKQARETMGMILEMDGVDVCYARNGKHALARLEKIGGEFPPIDLVILDLEMPEFSGMELLVELEGRKGTLPVMVVTGYASKKTVVELLRHGVVEYLDKPIQMVEFRARVKEILKHIQKEILP
jgi:two-component system, OmpR family, response regulator